MDKKKFLGFILGVILFIACFSVVTYAQYIWQSENTSLSFDIKDPVIEFALGPEVNVSDISPVLDYNYGVKTTFSVSNDADRIASVFVYLNIVSVDNELLCDCFRYKLLKDVNGGQNYTIEVADGDFSDFSVGNNLIVNGDKVDANSVTNYLFIVYIDGNVSNNIDMMDKSMESFLVISGKVVQDSIGPVCTISYNSATYDSVTVDFACNDDSGIARYSIAMTDGDNKSCAATYDKSNITTNISGTCTFNTFDLSSLRLSAVNKNAGASVSMLSSEQLESAYTSIYNVLNDTYEEEIGTDADTTFLDMLYPVGSVYISTSSTSPATIYGGTWKAYGAGRTLIGMGGNGNQNYTTVNATGGTETVTLGTTNLPTHSHNITPAGSVSSKFTGTKVTSAVNTLSSHTHSIALSNAVGYSIERDFGFMDRVIINGGSVTSTSGGAHTHTYTASGSISSTFFGSSVPTDSAEPSMVSAFSVLNPYIVTYMWRRTA